jgi:hypothetical protein
MFNNFLKNSCMCTNLSDKVTPYPEYDSRIKMNSRLRQPSRKWKLELLLLPLASLTNFNKKSNEGKFSICRIFEPFINIAVYFRRDEYACSLCERFYLHLGKFRDTYKLLKFHNLQV